MKICILLLIDKFGKFTREAVRKLTDERKEGENRPH